jgi:hypothetical protein
MNHEGLHREGEGWLTRFAGAGEKDRETMKAEGDELALRLVDRARDLGSSKATEFSPWILRFTLLAAKVALLARWPEEERLWPFERGIRYYRAFESSQPAVDEYERFRASWVDAGVVGG